MNRLGHIALAGQVRNDLRKQIDQATLLVQRPAPAHQMAGRGGGLRVNTTVADQPQHCSGRLNLGRQTANRRVRPNRSMTRIRLPQEQRTFALDHSSNPSCFDRRHEAHGTPAAVEPRGLLAPLVDDSNHLTHCAPAATARLAAIRNRFPARLALALHKISILDERNQSQ